MKRSRRNRLWKWIVGDAVSSYEAEYSYLRHGVFMAEDRLHRALTLLPPDHAATVEIRVALSNLKYPYNGPRT